MNGTVLVGFKRPKKVWDYVVALATLGKYSHCAVNMNSTWYEATTKGVISHQEAYNESPDWDIIEVKVGNKYRMEHFLKMQVGGKYDWLGILFSQIFPLHLDSKGWFCSELIIEALMYGAVLGLPHSKEVSPNRLYELLSPEKT